MSNQADIMIELSAEELENCKRYSKQMVSFYSNAPDSASNPDQVFGNIVGVKAEMGLRKLLFSRGYDVDVLFQEFNGKYRTLQIGSQRIEVKALRPCQWDKYRRMVAPGPLHYYASKRAVIVWALADADATTSQVTIKGFNFAREVRDKGTQENTPCNNIWLQDDTLMRSPLELQHFIDRHIAKQREREEIEE